MNTDLLKTILKCATFTILLTGVACNLFLFIPYTIDHDDVHFYKRYYQNYLSACLYACTIVLVLACFKKRTVAAPGNQELAEHIELVESRYADADDRAAIDDGQVADDRLYGELPTGGENTTMEPDPAVAKACEVEKLK